MGSQKKSQKKLHALPVSCKGKRVLIRADFDVAMKNGRIVDDFRIRKVVPTIRQCLKRGARVRIIAHLGRPNGKRDPSLTLKPVARHLERVLKKKVFFVSDPFRKSLRERIDSSERLILFENIRYWAEEEHNDRHFAALLAQWGDLYVNEAFAAHRAHASVVALARQLPAYMGPSFHDEITYLGIVRDHPKHPFVVILGGAKLEIKLPLLRRFLTTADSVLIGGLLANTIFVARGVQIGKSKSDRDSGVASLEFLRNKKLHVPDDVVVVKMLQGSARRTSKTLGEVDHDDYIVDIGYQSIGAFSSLLKHAATIVWNGPLGYTEVPEFTKGTKMLAQAIARTKALSVVGGGDTIAAVGADTLGRAFTHVSAGGGAMLEFLSGKKLPALEALKW
ncbi:MAG: phosphoglycerate kinase [Candidatus Sungbacteria bacterium]|nr:phosphoglycerate kinase [Candidatus Sungbacteria bacterium]